MGVPVLISGPLIEAQQESCELPRIKWRHIQLRDSNPIEMRAAQITGCNCSIDGRREVSGDFLPPSPPAEKANVRQDQAGQASTDDGAGDRNTSPFPEPAMAASSFSKASLGRFPQWSDARQRLSGHVRQRIKRSHRPKFILHLINNSCPVSDLLLPEQPYTWVPRAIVPIQQPSPIGIVGQ
jgi:hypothetical protein